jgi:predicted transcriptional regulator
MSITTIPEMTSRIVSAFLSRNVLPVEEIAPLTDLVHRALSDIVNGAPAPQPVVIQEPAVPIKKSITPDFIICLEDGLKFKSLRRHLGARYNLTPEAYRAKWGLPIDYPMVAPNYAAKRSELAKVSGLGRKGSEPALTISETVQTESAQPETVPVDEPVTTPVVSEEVKHDPHATFAAHGIVCLEDGKVVKDLGRHARKNYGLSATAYREKFGLPANYPMTVEGIAAFTSA